MEQALLEFLGKILAYAGGSAAVAFLIFRFLGQKWIESKFKARREEIGPDLKRLEETVQKKLQGEAKA